MSKRRPTAGLPLPVALTLATLGGLLFGGLTQLGQSALPESLHSLANSAAPWVLTAFGFALLSRARWAAALSGTLTLAGHEVGYIAVAAMRDLPSASTTVAFWLTAAVIIGPLVGWAAYFLRVHDPQWGGVGGGLVAGIVSGEGLVSFLTVRDTTTPGYWVTQMTVGALLLALISRRSHWAWALTGFAVGIAGLLATRSVPAFGS